MGRRADADEAIAAGEDESLLDETTEELYENAPVGYLSSLEDGEIIRVNSTFLGWTGHTRESLAGKRIHDLLAPGARIYYETHYAPLLHMQGGVREIAVEIVRADGTRMQVLMNSTLHRGSRGRVVIRTTVFDASDRRRYEQELLRARSDAESRARSALALAYVNEGVLLVSREGVAEVLNEAAERILAVVAEDVVGRAPAEAVPGWAELEPRIPVGEPGDRTPTSTLPLHHGGSDLWLSVAGVDSGDGVVYTFRDVTADHRLEQLRSDLVAIVSHELRTPLTGAYGAAKTLLERGDTLADGDRRMLLEMVVEQSARLTEIVDRILVTSRLDAGDVAAEAISFPLDEVARDLAGATPAASERLRVEADEEMEALGDRELTRQVLAHLVDNALKYSTGPVTVTVDGGARTARVLVSDDGPGIPQSERERVFEKFYRLDPAQRTGVGGTGLGLYIAQELVGRMNGRIGLVPRDEGTTVYVELPRAAG